MKKEGSRKRWYTEYKGVGYALGKELILYLIFDKRKKKEIDLLWSEYLEPSSDDNFRIRFVEDGDQYTFIMFNEGSNEPSFGFCKDQLDIKAHYSEFKKGFKDELLFTYGIKQDEALRLSERYKIVNDVKIMDVSEVEEDSIIRDAMASLRCGLEEVER